MHLRSFSPKAPQHSALNDPASLFISTADSSVKAAFEKAFTDTCELYFYQSTAELVLALPSTAAKNGAFLIDLDSESSQTKQIHLVKLQSQKPLILLSSEIETDACREFFHLGVDDVLLKPLNISELTVKTERALTNTQKTVRNYINFLGTLEAELTITELRILSHFFDQPARVANRKSLTDHIWSHDRIHPKALDVHLFNLRSKIAKAKMKIDYEPQLKGWRLKTHGN